MKNRHCYTFKLVLCLTFFFFATSLLNIANAQKPPSSDDNDYGGEGSTVSPSMAMIVLVLVLGFFITGCIAIYVQQCSDNSSIGDQTSVARNRNLMAANFRGLDQSVIETFPTFLYSDVKELKFGKESLECAVCLNEFDEDDKLRLLPKCDHVFHPECIDAWLNSHTTCPVCRANLVPDSADSSETQPESGPSYEVEVVVVPEMPKGRVLRSHSTGHSLSQPSQDRERFTLRLPEEVRKQLVVAPPKLKRSTSLLALTRVSSLRRGYRNGGDGSGSSRYGRFFGRSFRWTTKNNGGGDEDGNVGSKRFFGTVVTPLEGLTRVPV